MKAFLVVAVVVCFFGVGAAALFVWSGVYDIGATEPHWAVTEWLIGNVRDRSITAHSSDLRFPSPKDPKHVGAGISHYDGMCRFCHGAPGLAPYEFAKGLYPFPPPLMSEHVQERTDAELYWIVENGLKMTGMPAFGPTHKKVDLLGILALVRLLPDLSSQAYAIMLRSSAPHEEGGDHHQQESAGHSEKKSADPHGGGHQH